MADEKCSASKFADAADMSKTTVLRVLRTWDRMADDGPNQYSAHVNADGHLHGLDRVVQASFVADGASAGRAVHIDLHVDVERGDERRVDGDADMLLITRPTQEHYLDFATRMLLAFGFVFELQTEKPREAIEDAFSFVRDDATLHVIGPDATPQRLVELIDELPDSPRLGEILLSIGAVSYEQLERALNKQREVVSAEGAPRLGELLQADGVHPQLVEAALSKQQKSRESAPAAQDGNRYIRVQADRLDAVINLLGELVIAGAGAALLAAAAGDFTSPGLQTSGDAAALQALLGVLDRPDPGFNIITP